MDRRVLQSVIRPIFTSQPMKHIKQLSLSFIGAAAALVAMQASAQTVLTASSWLPPTHTLSMAQKEWCDLLEKNTIPFAPC